QPPGASPRLPSSFDRPLDPLGSNTMQHPTSDDALFLVALALAEGTRSRTFGPDGVAPDRYPRHRWTRAPHSMRSQPTPSSPAGSFTARFSRPGKPNSRSWRYPFPT